jgi:hypothetical protein
LTAPDPSTGSTSHWSWTKGPRGAFLMSLLMTTARYGFLFYR